VAYTSEIEKLERRWAENPKGRNFAPLADAYRKAGELDRAIELCQNGLALHPDYVSAHIVYGRCLIDMKNDTGAKEGFQKVLALDPENIIALKILGEIAERNSRFDEAVDWLGRLLNADPMNGDAAEALARAKTRAATAKPIAIAEAETKPLAKPDFEVEHETPEPVAPLEATKNRSPDVETFEGGLDFNASAHAAAKADGLEVQEDVELNAQQIEQVDVIGLARTQYEGSGMFRLDTPEGTDAPAPLPELIDDGMPQVDLPLIMPDDMPAAEAPAPPRPPPPPQPPPPPPPVAAVPAAVALSDDDGAADTATLSQAEPVLTETMAELYLKQGHQQDALRVYQALLAQRPKDAKLRRRVEELTGGGARRGGSGVSAQAFLKGIWSGRGSAPAPAAPEPAPTRAPPPPPAPAPAPDLAPAALQSTLEAAFDGADSVMSAPGEPSHPAQDHISLDSVFGDDSARRSTSGSAAGDGAAAAATAGGAGGSASGGGGAGGGAAPFSFDDFFGGSGGGAAAAPAAGADGGEGGAPGAPVEPGSARTPGRSSGRAQRPSDDEAEADQFQQWLKKLKS
jgi:tetratricopeptide (TPR) repeat protein